MRSKTIIPIIVISVIAILLSSFTIGRQIFLGRQPDIVSFSTIHFAGYLFFLLMPVELLFIYYLIEDFNIPILLVAALATAMVAQIIDYVIGYLVSNKVINKVIGEKKYKNTKKYIDKYGDLAVFVFNTLPLSSSILSLVAGMLRYRFRNFVIYSFVGLLIKYSAIVLLFS
ncbi:MAG: VTT domain-containing protein [Nanoarchaeota archaeon]|nr:VTT domain-containing protein [Nanoarchaeota archaeon]